MQLFTIFVRAIDKNYSYPRRAILICSLIFISVTFLIFNLLFVPKYPVNDDIIMMMISSGYFTGFPDEHIVFSSFLIGLILKFLYNIYLNLNWYTYYLTFLNFLSCFIILFSFFKIRQSIKTIIYFLILYLFILKDYCFFIQFSHTATLVTSGGLILYLTTLHSDKQALFDRIVAMLMIITGSLVRFDGAILVFVLYIPFMLYYILEKKFYRILKFLALVFSFIIIFKFANNLYYEKDKDWGYYNKLNYEWGLILNNPKFPSINTRDSIFSQINWSHNDRNVFFNYWILEDSLNYSLPKLKILFNQNKVTYKQIEFGRNNFKTWVGSQLWALHLISEPYKMINQKCKTFNLLQEMTLFANSYYNSYFLFISTFLLIFFVHKGFKIYYLLNLFVLMVLIIIFNASNSILFKPRVLNAMMISTLGIGLFHNLTYCKPLNNNKLTEPFIGFIFLFILSIITSFYFIVESKSNIKINANQTKIMAQIGSSFPNTPILILDGSKGFSTNNFNPFHNQYNTNSVTKIYYCSWLSQSPINKKIIKRLKSENFYSSLIEGKILIYNESEDLDFLNPLIDYFMEHFKKNITINSLNPQKTIYRVTQDVFRN
jgi:hypothetical protein